MHALLIMISTVPPDACRSYWYEVEAAREDHHIEFGSYSQLLVVLFEKKKYTSIWVGYEEACICRQLESNSQNCCVGTREKR
jgi:hypothetical protein